MFQVIPMPRCQKCGENHANEKCPFCGFLNENFAQRPSLEKMGVGSSDGLYFNPEKIKNGGIINHGIIVHGDMKTIQGDEIHPGATKVENKDGIIWRSDIGSSDNNKLRSCLVCGKEYQESSNVCPYCSK